jgi:hypothetical protein
VRYRPLRLLEPVEFLFRMSDVLLKAGGILRIRCGNGSRMVLRTLPWLPLQQCISMGMG